MSEKGSLLYLGGFELPEGNAAAHRVLNNAKILREIGYNVVLLDIDKEQKSPLEKREHCAGFERWSVPKAEKRVYTARNLIKVADGIGDLKGIIAYNHPAISLERLRRYCRRRGIKMLADVTEWYAAEGANVVHRVIKGVDTWLRMRQIQPRLDGVIAISRYLDEYYRDKTPTLVLPPLTDLEEDKWKIEPEKREDDRIQIVYAGAPGRNKDKLNLILRALSGCDLSKVSFRVIGLTKERYLYHNPEDAQLVESLGSGVVFLGRLPHAEAIREVKSADFSLFYREHTRVTTAGFPTKFAEAFTCGTPVITNKSSNLSDYLVDGVNGFWIDAIEEDLKRVLSNDVAYMKSIKKNMDCTVFDYRNYIEQTRAWMDERMK